MKRLRLAAIAVALLLLLGGAGYKSFCWLNEGNQPLSLWGTDDTAWKVLEEGDDVDRNHPVKVKVEVERLYGIRLGQPVKVRITTRSLNSTKIEFETILAGKLQRDPTPWRLYKKPDPPEVVKGNDGFTTRTFVVVVAVWEPPTLPANLPGNAETPNAAGAKCVAHAQGWDKQGGGDATAPGAAPSDPGKPMLWPFTMEFLYSSENMDNGLSKWQYQQIPCVNFGFSSTVEPNAWEHNLDFGPLGDVPPHPLMAGVAMQWVGDGLVVLGGLWLIWLLVGWVRRLRKPLELADNARQFHGTMAEAARVRNSFKAEELEYFAFRDYLGDATKSDAELLEPWRNHPQGRRIAETLEHLDRARLHPGAVSSFDKERAREFIAGFVPTKAPGKRFSLRRLLRPVSPSYLFSWSPEPLNDQEERS